MATGYCKRCEQEVELSGGCCPAGHGPADIEERYAAPPSGLMQGEAPVEAPASDDPKAGARFGCAATLIVLSACGLVLAHPTFRV